MNSNENIYSKILFSNFKIIQTVIECGFCKSKNVQIREHQTRSSDEPITIFIFCKSCQKTTVDNNK